MSSPLKVMFLCGGAQDGGSTVGSIIGSINVSAIPNAEVAAIIATKPDAGVIRTARRYSFPSDRIFILPRDEYPGAKRDEEILRIANKVGADAAMQSGWPHITGKSVIRRFRHRIWNQHPGAVDPQARRHKGHRLDFGGKGMYGIVPVAAALYFAQMSKRLCARFAYAIAHELTEYETDIDGGPIIGMRSIPVRVDSDTPESLYARLKTPEHFLHGSVLAHLTSCGSFPRCLHPPLRLQKDDTKFLITARMQAIQKYGKR